MERAGLSIDVQTRRQTLAVMLAAAMRPGHAQAQAYPTRPVQLVVAFGPGGVGDTVARLLARRLSASLGQPVLVENRPVPVAAVAGVAQAKPDGHTLLMAGSGTALTSALFTRLPYDLLKDFSAVSTLASFELVLLTGGSSRFDSWETVRSYAKAQPGRLNIACARLGSTQNAAAEMLRSMAGIDVVIVPYKTTADILSALRSGEVQVAFELVPAVLGQIRAGTVKALAFASSRRSPVLPEVPLLVEAGMPELQASSWNGIVVPAGTPLAVIDRLHRAIHQGMASPELQAQLLALGVVTDLSSPAQMAERLRADVERWRAVIDRAGMPRQSR